MQKTLKRYFPIFVLPTLIAFSFAFIIPVGICLTDCKDLTDTYYFRGDGIVMGIYANAEHVQTAVDLAEYLLNK